MATEPIVQKISLRSKQEESGNGIFYEGHIHDAETLVSELIGNASQRIIIVDNIADDSVLQYLSKREKDVTATICTEDTNLILRHDISHHNINNNPIKLRFYQKSKDCFLIIDNTVYHLDEPFNKIGKKTFSLSKMNFVTGNDLITHITTYM